jgi:hypothetical protein
MTKELAVSVMLVVGTALTAAAADDAREARRAEAPRLLKDAVAKGTVEDADFAAIADWIVHAREENVAAGLLEVLGAAEPSLAAAGGKRWEGTTRAVFSLFATALRDGQHNRRRSGQDLEPEIAALVGAAAPAIAETFREIDPEAKARISALLGTLAPLSHDLAPLLGADLSGSVREALEEIDKK